jgi:hypothetical protein
MARLSEMLALLCILGELQRVWPACGRRSRHARLLAAAVEARVRCAVPAVLWQRWQHTSPRLCLLSHAAGAAAAAQAQQPSFYDRLKADPQHKFIMRAVDGDPNGQLKALLQQTVPITAFVPTDQVRGRGGVLWRAALARGGCQPGRLGTADAMPALLQRERLDQQCCRAAGNRCRHAGAVTSTSPPALLLLLLQAFIRAAMRLRGASRGGMGAGELMKNHCLIAAILKQHMLPGVYETAQLEQMDRRGSMLVTKKTDPATGEQVSVSWPLKFSIGCAGRERRAAGGGGGATVVPARRCLQARAAQRHTCAGVVRAVLTALPPCTAPVCALLTGTATT